ncbi:MAG TPA: adenylate/guanylate cyclase domain-containing protein [Candidatus Dormibacteraeota bacterium]|nr:adenylate/guanylate cyclase domain-containing protein [Candidatus Dormibacteraeota bacterium]
MAALPRGTVTFLFTDVEASTRLVREKKEAYSDLLAEHRRALREAFARHRGVEVDTQGDSFFVAFARASDAVAAAEDGQRALSDGPVRVRMGLHTGEPAVTDEGYVGMDVHRAARIAAAGHGGQILMSQSTRELSGRTDVRDLGEHRLKDLPGPERIYQLGDQQFAPLRTIFATNLPVPLTRFVGRHRELAETSALLLRDDVRLVTMTGPGGSGKTRLALEIAGTLAESYEHGVWWVPLTAVSEPEDVMPALARVLGGGSATEAIGSRRLLVLLDNFEQVIGAAPDIAALLASCPRVDVLVTSRERLSVQGEHVYLVLPLARQDARELFLDRARSASPSFEPGKRLDELCARLDDLPLAIELAAARTPLLNVTQLLERLGTRLDLLRAGRDAEARHQTLRTTIEWSYELLSPGERRLLAALSVFRVTWTLETAELVAEATLEELESLVEKSLVRRLESGRFTMLETILEFAAEHLEPRERDRILVRLVKDELTLFADANLSEESLGPPQMDFAHAERANLDVALAWAARPDYAQTGIRLLLLTEMYWITNDPVVARERMDALFAQAGERIEPALRARVHRFRAATFDMSTSERSRDNHSEREYIRAVEAFREANEEDQIAPMMARIANAAVFQGDVERAVQLATDSLGVARQRKNRGDEAFALSVLAKAAFAQGDLVRGAQLAHESAELLRQAGQIWLSGVTLLGTSERLITAGHLEEAVFDLGAGLETLAAVSDRVNIPYAFAAGAALAVLKQDILRAGVLWGALEATAEREPRSSTREAMQEYAPYIEPIRGAEFDRGRARGRDLSLEEAVEYALASHNE